ncbi:beta-lactamase-like protein [Lipomyces tetrasporus]
MTFNKFVSMLLCICALAINGLAQVSNSTQKEPLRVETYVNTDQALDMVSSLVIGNEAAMIIDLPITIGKAKELASWVKATTDKPLAVAFTSHNHPDHYLGGAAFFEEFPGILYYANSRSANEIRIDAPMKTQEWSEVFGEDNIVQNASLPLTYDYSFFSLPGDEDSPVYLLEHLTGDTIDETMFWIPSIQTLIAADTVWSRDLHIWMADLLTPALTESWIATLEFIRSLQPSLIIPGHSLSNAGLDGSQDLNHSYSYLTFWQQQIESRGPNYFTPREIYDRFDSAFPGLIRPNARFNRLNITAENFGRGGKRIVHHQPLSSFNDSTVLDAWNF